MPTINTNNDFSETIMHTTALRPRSPLVDRWQCQIGRRLRLDIPLPRPFAALDVLVRGGDHEGLVPIEWLTFILLHDVVELGVHDGHRLRLAGYGIQRDPCGVAIGGVEAHKFEKNLLRRHTQPQQPVHNILVHWLQQDFASALSTSQNASPREKQ